MANVCKFQQQKYQYSPDSGQTWIDTSETRAKPGEPIERNSNYCGYRTPSSRTVSDGYVCVGYNKHSAIYEEVTYDGGTTWDRIEGSARPGSLIEKFSSDCCQLRTVTGTVCTEFMRKANANIEEASLDGEIWIQTGRYDVIGYIDDGYSIDCIQSAKVKYFNTSDSGDTNPHYTFGYYNYKISADTDTGMYVTDRSMNLYSCCGSPTYSNGAVGQERILHYFGNCYGKPFQRNSNLLSYRVSPESSSNLSETGVYFETDSFGMICDNSGSFDGITGLTHLDNFENTRYTVIGDATFNNCGLIDVHIPKSISLIGNSAFSNNQNLTSVTIDSGALYPGTVSYLHTEGNNEYSFANCTSLKNVNFNNYSGFITNGMFSGCQNLSGATIGNPIVIGSYAFKNCSSLTSINLGKNLKKLGEESFAGCTSLTSVTIPEDCGYYPKNIFSGCTNLADIYIDAIYIKSITLNMDYHYQTFPSDATYHLHCYNVNTWASMLIENFDVPPQNIQLTETGCVETRWVESGTTCSGQSGYDKYVLEVEQMRFGTSSTWYNGRTRTAALIQTNSQECGYIPSDWFIKEETVDGVVRAKSCSDKYGDASTINQRDTNLSGYGIDRASVKKVWIRDACETHITTLGPACLNYGDSSFRSLEEIYLPDSITTIGERALSGNKNISSLTLSDSITTINKRAFGYMTGLTNVEIGTGITYIDDYAFVAGQGGGSYHPSINSFTIRALVPPTIGTDILAGQTNVTIYVPAESLQIYKTAASWSSFGDKIQPIV